VLGGGDDLLLPSHFVLGGGGDLLLRACGNGGLTFCS
jgi:hypothetical protein